MLAGKALSNRAIGILVLARNALVGFGCAYFLPALTRAHLFRWPALIRASPSGEM
jgi:hypothetical protein